MPDGPHPSLLDCHHVNPPLLEPGDYAIDAAAYGRDQVTGTFVLSPGDVRGTRFVHELVQIGCWSLVGWSPCVACDSCGSVVASRTDDCRVAQETRFYPSTVVREDCGDEVEGLSDPFALIAGWDDRRSGWTPALAATRWGGRGLRDDLFRDDPPA